MLNNGFCYVNYVRPKALHPPTAQPCWLSSQHQTWCECSLNVNIKCVCVSDPLTYVGMIQDLHYSNFSEELKRVK